MELTLKNRIFYFFPVLYCFCLPFGSLVQSGIVILWGVTALFNLEKQKIIEGLKNKTLWLFYLYFFIIAISALLSENKSEGMFNIEKSLSFIFLPFFFFCFYWPPQIIIRSLIAFVSGCFIAAVSLLIRAAFYWFNGHPEYFFYSLFSDYIHTAYFSMYLMLAIAIIFIYYTKWFKEQKQVLYLSYFMIGLFAVVIFLCRSKLGTISFFICVPLLIFYKYKNFFNLKKVLVLIAGMVVIIFSAYKLFPGAFERLKSITNLSVNSIDKTSSESTAVRVLIWKEALGIIGGNFITGVGSGDTNDALYESYRKNGLTGAYEHKLNAHNQYLQTFVGLGFIGFSVFMLLTLGQLVRAILKKNFIFFLFMFLTVINFMVESMLQKAAGVLFFVFFLCLFSLDNYKSILNEKK